MNFKSIGLGGTIILGAIALATNPVSSQYQKYADQTIKTKVKDKVCEQVATDLGVWLEGQCHILVTAASPYLAEAIDQQSTRQNFWLFSIYKADLPLPEPLPDYHLETLGIFGNFHIYRAGKL